MESRKNLPLEAFGWYGTMAILGAYALLSFSILEAMSIPYQLLNATGGLGIFLLCWYKRAYQPAVINLVWTVIASISLLRMMVS
jgi:hypothetical protein